MNAEAVARLSLLRQHNSIGCRSSMTHLVLVITIDLTSVELFAAIAGAIARHYTH